MAKRGHVFLRGITSQPCGDSVSDLLEFPRHMAAVIIAGDAPAPQTIVDVAAGAGAVLAAFLEHFPDAKGIWTDASRAMHDLAREKLAPFSDRVEYYLADMTDLGGAGLPERADVITAFRAPHHLDCEGLARFYADAAARLKPGGWLVHLDHIAPACQAGPSVQDHLDAFGAAGITDVEVPWRAFSTCLFLGRKAARPDEPQERCLSNC